MNLKEITLESNVEDLVREKPEILSYLMKKGLCGLACGSVEPGSIADLAERKKFSRREIDEVLNYLNTVWNGN